MDNPTPIVRINRITPFKHTKIYAKLEWYNPFGAVKDRVAAYREAGVTVLNVQPVGPNGLHDVETLATWLS